MGKNPRTILIVDDEAMMREALGELLSEEGYHLAFAANGTEALTKARDILPDLVLLDVMLPDIDGFTVCQNLRADQLLAQVPIVIITSLGDRDSRLRGFAAGADDYVTKPIDEPELLARVRTTTQLNRHRKLLEAQASRETSEKELKRSLEETARSQQLLLALSQAAQAVQRARTPEEVYQTIAKEILKLGYHATIFTLTEDGKRLSLGYMTFESGLLQAAERLTGLSAWDYCFSMKPGGFHERIFSKGKPVLSALNDAPVVEALPKTMRPLAGKLADLLGVHKAIYVPLKVAGRAHALLTVIGADLTEDDAPAMNTFAGQAAIAIENAQLYQTIQQERDRMQRYLDIAGVMLVAINAKGEITLINRKGCEILGYKENEILGKNWFDTCLPSAISDSAKSIFDQLIAGKTEPVEYHENPIETKSGGQRLIAWYNTVLKDEAGNIVGTLSSGEDITERAQTEEALRETQTLLGSVVEQSPAAMVIAAPDGTIMTFNHACLELLGIADEPDMQAGSNLFELQRSWREYDTDGHPVPLEELPLVLALQGKTTLGKELRVVRKDGTERWEIVNSAPIYDKNSKLIAGFVIFQDTTEHKLADEALHQSEETARALLNATNDLAILITPDGTVLAGNERVAQAVGIDVGEMIGTSIEDFLTADLLGIGTAQVDHVRRSGEAIRFQVERQSGTLDISIYPVFGAQGELARFAVFAHDVTEQIKARQAIERRNRELAALNDIGQSIVSTLDLQKMLTLIAEHTNQLMGMAATSIVLREEADDGLYFAAASGEGADEIVGQRLAIDQGIAGWVIQHEKPVLIPDVSQDERWYSALDKKIGFSTRSILCVPLKSKELTIGALEALNKPDGFTQDDLRLLSAMAVPVATAIENARLFKEVRTGREQLQSLSRRLVEMQEAERAHVARELHDETGQALSGMLLSLSLLEQEADQPKEVKERVGELLVLVDDMLENLHRLAMNLRPATLDHLGLLPALEQYIETFKEQYGIETQFEVVNLGSDRLPPEMETALYRIVQESLTNIVRHAQATRIDVLVARRDNQVVTIVEDNGGGFDPESAMQASRLGLLGMRERAEMLNGRLVIESVPGSGTTVLVEVPYLTT